MIDSITGLDIFSPLTVLVRLCGAMIAGFLVGYEREQHYQPAGLRTHMVLSLGACLVMLISIYIPPVFMKESPGADPGRLSAQVISGIGFLGAGAIFKYGFNVKGLTTAASIWTMSAIGLAFGAGFTFWDCCGCALVVIAVLQVKTAGRTPRSSHTYGCFRSAVTSAGNSYRHNKEHDIDITYFHYGSGRNGTTEVVINCRMESTSARQLFEK